MSIGSSMARRWFRWYPRRDSNPRTRLRRPVLYPLSYGGSTPSTISLSAPGNKPSVRAAFSKRAQAARTGERIL